MEGYKRGSHTVWDCKYHVVWTTKYRFPVLGGDVGARCRELIRETARAHEMIIHAGAIDAGPPSESADGRTDPALSRNLKPPALAGGGFTLRSVLRRSQRTKKRSTRPTKLLEKNVSCEVL
jgi:hypothetical protein